MNFKNFNVEDLVKPSDFELISRDDLFEEILTTVNDELERQRDSGDEIYEGTDANVEVYLDSDEAGEEVISADIVEKIKQTYKEIGWRDVTYKFVEETEDEDANHTFNFYFNSTSNNARPVYSI